MERERKGFVEREMGTQALRAWGKKNPKLTQPFQSSLKQTKSDQRTLPLQSYLHVHFFICLYVSIFSVCLCSSVFFIVLIYMYRNKRMLPLTLLAS